MFNVNADLFRAAALFQSSEETRYYLAGVHVEAHPAGGVLLVTTDGTRMFVTHDESGMCDAGLNGFGYIVALDAAALKAAKRAKGETGPRRIIGAEITAPAWVATCNHKDGAPLLETASNVHMVNGWNVDGSFPDWRRVLPTDIPDDKAPRFESYDPILLATYATAAAILADDRRGAKLGILLRHGVNGGPALIRFAGAAHAFGVLMPTRGDFGAPGLPEFLNRQPAVAQAA
jgi:hypothetical protein